MGPASLIGSDGPESGVLPQGVENPGYYRPILSAAGNPLPSQWITRGLLVKAQWYQRTQTSLPSAFQVTILPFLSFYPIALGGWCDNTGKKCRLGLYATCHPAHKRTRYMGRGYKGWGQRARELSSSPQLSSVLQELSMPSFNPHPLLATGQPGAPAPAVTGKSLVSALLVFLSPCVPLNVLNTSSTMKGNLSKRLGCFSAPMKPVICPLELSVSFERSSPAAM